MLPLFNTIFITPSGKPLLPLQSLLIPPLSWQLLIDFLSRYDWAFHINGIIQNMASCVWLTSFSIRFSRFTHVTACIGTLLFFSPNYIPLYGSAAAAVKSLQSCPTLCDPIGGSPPGSSVPGILQARTLEWGAIAFSDGSITFYLFIHQFTWSKGQLGCFHILSVVNNAVRNLYIRGIRWLYVFSSLGYISRSGMAGSLDKSV